ncbi:hypothetical protein [Brevibacterium sp. UCMA 11752]|uniref:hypothetical protein n=1 Tax=Brevibacterium sp. UCMA 11752 TaxID=2745946 RepID=UPI001F21224E|nr:hypothetical protein [Brevibacterium sp. UCMA 11752]MCF2588942.1 hypothetical protein [Brevibacterium sp. UCMA 11752]
MSNYIDLEPQISDYYGTIPGQERRAGICDALRFLDSHPEHVPGRTITEGELDKIADECRIDDTAVVYIDNFAKRLGITVVPEPTEAEKLAEIISEYTYNSEPQALAEALVRAGVKAPGGESDDC